MEGTLLSMRKDRRPYLYSSRPQWCLAVAQQISQSGLEKHVQWTHEGKMENTRGKSDDYQICTMRLFASAVSTQLNHELRAGRTAF
jgi:hypothetical protein